MQVPKIENIRLKYKNKHQPESFLHHILKERIVNSSIIIRNLILQKFLLLELIVVYIPIKPKIKLSLYFAVLAEF